jgi:large subunit ribosomal protein LP0
MTVVMIFSDGQAFSPEVLDIEEKTLIDQFLTGVKTVAAVSLALNFPTLASVTHSLVNSYKNLLAVALATEWDFEACACIAATLQRKTTDMLAQPRSSRSASPTPRPLPPLRPPLARPLRLPPPPSRRRRRRSPRSRTKTWGALRTGRCP